MKDSENRSPSTRSEESFNDLRGSQGDIPPRLPTQADFSPPISLIISQEEPDEPIEHIIIYLHEIGGDELSLKELEKLAQRLKKRLPRSAYLIIRNVQSYREDSKSPEDEESVKALLTNVINRVLISKCNFTPSNIMLVGRCQGGMTALATAALWYRTEFGGVISIGGSLPSLTRLPPEVKAKTPALILRGTHPSALQRIKETFVTVDVDTRGGADDTLPATKEDLRPILDFFAHRFHREEWKKQAIVSFDGGGIRGLGSLIILQELMNKIGDEERRMDWEDDPADSSFSPCLYKPRFPTRVNSESSEEEILSGTDLSGLPYSSLYLPCHYFTYAAGTSTGGLISIMLSRFRMTVDDCIHEYKSLGERIFGHPRPLAKGAILWHKFSAQVLEKVIQDVTAKHNHNETDDFPTFPSDEDLCSTVVYAYADRFGNGFPYAFRTYYCPPRRSASGTGRASSRRGVIKNDGDAPKLPIWQVARATSAAPGYFREITISTGNGNDPRDCVRFKDGGFGTNNPTEEAYYDIARKHGGESKIGIVISIGTGKTPLDLFARRPGNLNNAIANLRAATKLPSMTFKAHEGMLRIAERGRDGGEENFHYYRFDGGEPLGEIAMDEWKSHHFTKVTGHNNSPGFKTIRKIELGTAAYLQDRGVQRDLADCAKLLVRRRRLRTRDVSEWDRYASASYYDCDRCPSGRIKTSQAYKDHMKKEHGTQVADPVREKTRRCWRYGNKPTGSGP